MKIKYIPGTNIPDIEITDQEVIEVCSKPEPIAHDIGITPADIVSITDIHTAEKLWLAIIELRNVEMARRVETNYAVSIMRLKNALKDMPEDTRAVDFINEVLVKLTDKRKKVHEEARRSRTCFEKVKESLKEEL